eukprot:3850179-Prymnesium_polylepis.1
MLRRHSAAVTCTRHQEPDDAHTQLDDVCTLRRRAQSEHPALAEASASSGARPQRRRWTMLDAVRTVSHRGTSHTNMSGRVLRGDEIEAAAVALAIQLGASAADSRFAHLQPGRKDDGIAGDAPNVVKLPTEL